MYPHQMICQIHSVCQCKQAESFYYLHYYCNMLCTKKNVCVVVFLSVSQSSINTRLFSQQKNKITFHLRLGWTQIINMFVVVVMGDFVMFYSSYNIVKIRQLVSNWLLRKSVTWKSAARNGFLWSVQLLCQWGMPVLLSLSSTRIVGVPLIVVEDDVFVRGVGNSGPKSGYQPGSGNHVSKASADQNDYEDRHDPGGNGTTSRSFFDVRSRLCGGGTTPARGNGDWTFFLFRNIFGLYESGLLCNW